MEPRFARVLSLTRLASLGAGPFAPKAVAQSTAAALASQDARAYLLADAIQRALSQKGGKVTVSLPATAPGQIASVMVLRTRAI